MNTEKKSTMINVIALVILAACIVLMSLGLFKGFLTSSQANFVTGAGIIIFWILSDIVEPLVCDKLKNLDLSRKEAYVKYIVIDLVGYAGIMYFLMGVGSNGSSSGIIGAAVYLVSMRLKRDQRDIFLGLVSKDEDKEE